jgi:hypothetical protein
MRTVNYELREHAEADRRSVNAVVHERGNACIRVKPNILGCLQIVGSGALFYQLIGLANLLEHPQASHRSGSGVAVQLKHCSTPNTWPFPDECYFSFDCTLVPSEKRLTVIIGQ